LGLRPRQSFVGLFEHSKDGKIVCPGGKEILFQIRVEKIKKQYYAEL